MSLTADTIRRTVRQRRHRQSQSPHWSQDILDATLHFLHWLEQQPKQPQQMASFLALPDEFSTDPLHQQLWQHSHVALSCPVIEDAQNGQMAFYPFDATTAWTTNRFGIREIPPAHLISHHKITPRQLDLCLIPLVAFDHQGHRLGMGGGFYDRFLPQTSAIRLGWAHECQHWPACLPTQPWDQALDGIVTNQGIRWWTKPE